MIRRMSPRTNGRRATIRDVAAAAGVSITTVSHAINGKGDVDPATQAKVLDAAARLGYRASRAARALRAGRSHTIALLLPGFGAEEDEMLALDYYVKLASGATRRAFARDHALILAPSLGSADDARRLGVDGAIVCDPSAGDPRIDALTAADVPVVTVERDLARPDDRWHVCGDNAATTRLLLDHLASAGAERIALLGSDADWAWARESTDAYADWCATAGQDPIVELAGLRDLERSAEQHAQALLGDAARRPDAIVALAERHARGVVRAADRLGLRIPDDLLVASGIDSSDTREGVPSITAVDLHPEARGAAAAEMLIGRLEGEEPAAPRIVAGDLLVRASTTPAAVPAAPARQRARPV
jgi:DNA-binding LacI/PurR family transcriptional regulator